MATSLEGRVPFLDDHRVVEFAWRLPLSMKVKNGRGKWLLRQLLYKYVPQELIDRPKSGFDVPVGEWLREPLRDWAESLLDPAAMRSEGYFDTALVQRRWHSHLKGEKDSTQALWTILMFQAWLAENRHDAHKASALVHPWAA